VFFLLFALILAIIGRVPGLGENNKTNRYGKVVAFTIALLSCIGIYMLNEGRDMLAVINEVLTVYTIFAGAVIAILLFGIIYFGFRHAEKGRWQLAMVGIGLLMAIAGYFITSPSVESIGWLLGILGLILYISSAGLRA